MTSETDSPVAGLLRQAGDYAQGRPWGLRATDVVEGRVTPVRRGARGPAGPDRRRRRARMAAPVVAVALSAALVIGLVVGLGGGARGHGARPPTTLGPVTGPLGGRSLLLVAERGDTLAVTSPITGRLLDRMDVRWSGAPFQFIQFVTAPGAKYAYVEGQEGFGGPIIFGMPLAGHGPPRLVTSAGPAPIGAMALSPGGRRLAWMESGHLLVDDLATGKVTTVRLLLPSALAAAAPVLAWSASGRRLAVVASQLTPGGRQRAAVLEYDAVTGSQTPVRLAAASERAIGTALTGAAWSGEDLYVASEQCLPDEKCLGPGGGSPLAELDLSDGHLVRTFSSLQSVLSVAVDPRTGDLVVTGQREGPHLHPLFLNYLQVLGGRPLQPLLTLHEAGSAQWVPASAFPSFSAARRLGADVPDVVFDLRAKAVAILELAGFRLRLEPVPQGHPAIRPGTILSQSPTAGAPLGTGAVVTLRYMTGG